MSWLAKVGVGALIALLVVGCASRLVVNGVEVLAVSTEYKQSDLSWSSPQLSPPLPEVLP